MTKRTIFFGRFIDVPIPEDLRIRSGAVLVAVDEEGARGMGRIEKAIWDVDSDNDEDVRAKLLDGSDGGNSAVEIVRAGEDRFFFPGFIDTHIHAPQYPNAGIFGKSTLLDWLTTYTFPLESSLGSLDSPMYSNSNGNSNSKSNPSPLARAQTVYNRIIHRTLSHGTTTASYFATLSVPATNLLASLCFQRGQRALIGRVCMDEPMTCPEYYRDASPEESLAASQQVIAHCRHLDPHGLLVAPIITPRFAPSCTATSLANLGKLASDEGVRVQTHLSENKDECALVRSLFPDRQDYTDVYDHAGLLTEKTILAHAIHLSDQEIKVIKDRKAKVSHCPSSNMALGSGDCEVRRLLEGGVDVGLGTDVSGGWGVSILEAVRGACVVSRSVGRQKLEKGEAGKNHNIGVAEGLWLATLGGAKVVGLQDKVGLFEEGMLWDAQEVDLGEAVQDIDHEAEAEPERDMEVQVDGDVAQATKEQTAGKEQTGGMGNVDIFGWESWDDRVAKWVWNGDDRNVRRVWVGGRLVHERA